MIADECVSTVCRERSPGRAPSMDHLYDTHVPNPLVEENVFRGAAVRDRSVPAFAAIRNVLPDPFWEGHDDAIACYWKAWELAFGNLRLPAPDSGFVSAFIDTAFNDCLFMWDSAFALLFGRYGSRAFDFQKTLDNFYAHQHKDGYICREIRECDGAERFERFDPAGTGPNILPWCEWESFRNTGDRGRLARVFPPLLAYTQWMRKHRTWQDGTGWASGWGCGMDNQPRLPPGYAREFDHGHMSWIDITCQQILADRVLGAMARVLGRRDDADSLAAEADRLAALVNETMWNESTRFYADRFRGGALSDVKSVGSYWALLAEAVPEERLEAFLSHLSDERAFNRPHRVPSLSADHPDYDPGGGYWRGAVWAPTTYMVLRGLTHVGRDALAHAIARNHLDNVVAVFRSQGTLFENYAPENPEGKCRRDFVGWTGIPPIAVLFEYAFGLRPAADERRLVWDVRLLEEHGVNRYPFGPDIEIDLHCAKRRHATDAPRIQVRATGEVELVVLWDGGRMVINCPSEAK